MSFRRTPLSVAAIFAWADDYRSPPRSPSRSLRRGDAATPLTAGEILAWATERAGRLGSSCPAAAPPVRIPPTGEVTVHVQATAEIPTVLEAVAAAMLDHGYRREDVFAFRLCLEEALVNAVKHGHGYDPEKAVVVRCQVTPSEALADVEDEGPGFDLAGVPDSLAPENWDRPSGRGLLLMRRYLSWVRYNERGNRVTLCRRRSASGPAKTER